MRRFPIIVTNLIKLAGLLAGLIAPHGAFSTHPEALVLAFAGFAMAGAQMSEQAIWAWLGRWLGTPPPDKTEGAPPTPTSSGE